MQTVQDIDTTATGKKPNEKHALLHTFHIVGLQIAPGRCSNEKKKRIEESHAVGEDISNKFS